MTTNTPEQPDDAALERLRAADPAAGTTPDEQVLEAAVRGRVPEAFETVEAGTASDAPSAPLTGPDGPGGAVEDELAARRARRRRAPLQVAAAVAGALVVGAGGYALGAGGAVGAAGDSQAVSFSTNAGPIELGTAGSAGAASEESAAVAPESLAAGSRVASSDMAYAGFWGGRTVFHQDGLSTQGAAADAWAYDAAGVFSQETARRVADALGVPGDVREEYGSYTVGSDDWTGPSVSLQPDGLASVSYNDPTKDPWGCVVVQPMPATQDGAAGSTDDDASSSTAVEPGTCAEPEHGAPPAGDAAVDELRTVLTSLGLDAAGYEVLADEQVADQGAPRATTVTAYEVVDGQRTGTAWSATFSGAGLSSLYGSLAPRVPLGSYDVVSPAEAVERLGDPRFSPGGPIAFARDATLEQAVPETAVEAETPTVPATVRAGTPFSWPVTDVTITDARLGLAVQYQPDGAAVLVPAYELRDADGSTWSAIAVASSHLTFTPAP